AVSRVQQASAVVASTTDVDLSHVGIAQMTGTRCYLNSEGSKTVVPIQVATLTMFGEAQANDGMPVRETFSLVERTVQEFPAPAQLAQKARDLAANVAAEKSAPIGEEFAGPVLLEGIGSAQFISETLVHIMHARRPPDADNPRMMQVTTNPFLNRTGLRVMADAFVVSDTPSLNQFDGKNVV